MCEKGVGLLIVHTGREGSSCAIPEGKARWKEDVALGMWLNVTWVFKVGHFVISLLAKYPITC